MSRNDIAERQSIRESELDGQVVREKAPTASINFLKIEVCSCGTCNRRMIRFSSPAEAWQFKDTFYPLFDCNPITESGVMLLGRFNA